jgi:hypothetical protein
MGDGHNPGEIREYRAIVWRGDDYLAGELLTLLATSLADARTQVEAKYGADIKSSIWNEEDANRPR